MIDNMKKDIQRQFKGLWIPKEICDNKNLTIIEKWIFAEIFFLDGKEGCFASNKYFSELLNMSADNISLYIKRLKDKGFIREQSFNGRQRVLRSNYQFGLSEEPQIPILQTSDADPSKPRSLLYRDNSLDNIYKAEQSSATHLIVNYFFELKGWDNKGKEFYKDNKIVYARHAKSARQLLDLVKGNLEEAKNKLIKVANWANIRKLDWSIETVFKKWHEIDSLTEKEKKPFIEDLPAFFKNNRWYIKFPDGEIKEYAGESQIVYK